jgi:hypothetical protein
MNAGTLDDNGQPLVQAFEGKRRIDIGLELLENEQRVINDSFYITLLQIVVEHPKITATEALQRAQEQGMLLGPVIGRQQEFLGVQTERELDIMARAGEIPEMPEALLEAGGGYKLEYDSPLTRIQRSGEGLAVARTMETMLPVAELKPEVMDVYDWDAIARGVGEINGMPAKQFLDPKVVEANRAKREQQMQAAQAVEAAPMIAGAAKDLAAA